MSNIIELDKGDLLIAEPYMKDPAFKRTVTLLCEHEKDGSIGLVLNRPSIFKVNEMIPNFPHFEAAVYYGGPVGMDRLNYLHAYGDLLEGSLKVTENIYWNGNFDQLKSLVKARRVMPQNIKFFAGYAGWGDGQLAEEMQENSWIICKDYPEIFKMSEYMWQEVLIKMGGKNKLIAQLPEDPNLN